MSGKVVIGCKLPHGVVLFHPENRNISVTINGLNKVKVLGSTHAFTEIDSDFWEAWATTHEKFQPLLSGAIFVASSPERAKAQAKELADEKTGLEPMPQEALGVEKDDGK